MILLDTNVLVYAANTDAPEHGVSHATVTAALEGRVPAALVPQVILEFYSVVTQARLVPRPWASREAWERVTALQSGLQVLPVDPGVLDILGEMVAVYRPAGPRVFDLFLAAQMRSHGLDSICTYDTSHFAGIPGVEALTPAEVLERYKISRG